MRIHEVADEWGVSTRTVYRLIQEKYLPADVLTDYIPVKRYDISPALVSQVAAELKKLSAEGRPRNEVVDLLRMCLHKRVKGVKSHKSTKKEDR